MAAAQVSRSFWHSSKCARLELHRSITAARPFPQLRTTHASSSVLGPIDNALPTISETISEFVKEAPKVTTGEPSVIISKTRAEEGQNGATEATEATPKKRGRKPKVPGVEGEVEKPKTRKRSSKDPEVEGEVEKPKTRKRRNIALEVEGEGEKPKTTQRKSKVSEVQVGNKKKLLPRPSKSLVVEVEEDNPLGIPNLNLPPMNQWKEHFKTVNSSYKRPTIRNPETARMLAEKFIPSGSRDKIVIETSAGPGQLSRALLKLPKERIKKLIIIEPINSYFQYLKPLEQVDDRVTVVNLNGRDWGTFTAIEKMGLLKDVEIIDWEQIHPHLHFIMQMGGGVDGELVASQLLRTIPDRQWLFRFGRMPMNLVLTDRMYERFKAPEVPVNGKSPARCKVSVMAQAVSHFSESVPYDALQPYADHFHPERHNLYEEKYADLDSRRPGNPHVAVEVIPMSHPYIKPGDLDFWDYIVRKLFVVKATPLEKSINALGPGAFNILKKLTQAEDPKNTIDLRKSPRNLDTHEWSLVVDAFKNWPFRPTNLGIDQMFAKEV